MNDEWFEKWRNAFIGGLIVSLAMGSFPLVLAMATTLVTLYYGRSFFLVTPPPQTNDAEKLLEQFCDEAVERAMRRRSRYRR